MTTPFPSDWRSYQHIIDSVADLVSHQAPFHPTPDPMAVMAGIIERTRNTNGIAMAELTKAVSEPPRHPGS